MKWDGSQLLQYRLTIFSCNNYTAPPECHCPYCLQRVITPASGHDAHYRGWWNWRMLGESWSPAALGSIRLTSSAGRVSISHSIRPLGGRTWVPVGLTTPVHSCKVHKLKAQSRQFSLMGEAVWKQGWHFPSQDVLMLNKDQFLL